MIRRMKEGILLKRSQETNAYAERLERWNIEIPIEIAISQSTGHISELNEVLSINSTHFGYTKSENVSVKDKVVVDGKTYRVEYITETDRMKVLSLAAEWQIS